MTTRHVILDKRMLVEKPLMPQSAVDKRYIIQLFEEKSCAKCDNKPDRPNDLCRECPAFVANYKLYKEVRYKGRDWWSVPQGDAPALLPLLRRKGRDFRVHERRPAIPFAQPIAFTGSLFGAGHVDANGIPRVDQRKLARTWWETKNGMIKARPRAGKTVVAVRLCCGLGQRTVIVANRFKLLKQFLRTFIGDDKREAMTNIPDIRTNTGREVIRLATKTRDLQNLDDVDILLVNYQKLVRDPERFRTMIDDNFSFLIIDEAHGAGAEGYLRVASSCSVRHRLSLTATPRRKDNRHKLIHRVLGPTVAESESVSLIPNVTFFESAAQPPRAYKIWHQAFGWMCKSKERNIEIVRQVFKDLRAGHTVIIIPVDWKNHQHTLVQMINHQARMNNTKRGEDWPEALAVAFHAKSNADAVFERVDGTGPCVLVGIRSMIREGVDMERPSKLYVVIPMSATTDHETGAPMFDQLANRVTTPAAKPQPEVLIWVDNVQMFRNCITGLWYHEIVPNRYNGTVGKYRLLDTDFERMKNVSRKKKADPKIIEMNNGGWA